MKARESLWLVWIVLGGLAARIIAWGFFYGHVPALVTYRLPDDALYYFTVARNIADGFGVSFDSVHATNGMHPLWLLVITPIFLLKLTNWGSIHAILLLQSLLDLLVIWYVGKTVYGLLPNAQESNRRTAASSAALLYALSPLVIIHGINGLETALVSLLSVLWLRRFLKLNAYDAANMFRDWLLLGITTGLLLLARTDSFILLLPSAIYVLISTSKKELAGISVCVAAAAMIVAPWLLWNIATFGSPLQSSAEAVPLMAMRKYDVMYGSSFLKYFHLSIEGMKNSLKPFWYSTFGLSLVTICYGILKRKKKISPAERAIYLMLLGGMLLLIVHTISRGFIREWYVLGLIPLFLIGYGVSIGMNSGENASRSSGRWMLVVIIIIVQCFWFTGKQYASQKAVVYSGLPTVQALTRHSKVGALNSGYYSYFASRPGSVVDVDGVMSPDAIVYIKRGNLRGYLRKDSVDYFLDFAGDIGGYQGLIDPDMLADYVLDTAIECAPGDSLKLYRKPGLPRVR
jgi:hypothetical protein